MADETKLTPEQLKAQQAAQADLRRQQEAETQAALAMLNSSSSIEDTLATVWDGEPVVYVTDEKLTNGDTRKVPVVLQPTFVTRAEKQRRDSLRERFAALNRAAKEQARAAQEAEIKALGLTKEQAEDYRNRYPYWEIAQPEPFGVIYDSRIQGNRAGANAPTLPVGLRRTA